MLASLTARPARAVTMRSYLALWASLQGLVAAKTGPRTAWTSATESCSGGGPGGRGFGGPRGGDGRRGRAGQLGDQPEKFEFAEEGDDLLAVVVAGAAGFEAEFDRDVADDGRQDLALAGLLGVLAQRILR